MCMHIVKNLSYLVTTQNENNKNNAEETSNTEKFSWREIWRKAVREDC